MHLSESKQVELSYPGGEEEDKHGWMKEVCDVVNDSIPEVRMHLLLPSRSMP